MRWQASTAVWKAGLFEFRSLFEPPCRRKPGWPPLPVTGSGKSLTPSERMHLAKLRYSLSNCACCTAPRGDDALCVAVESSCATRLPAEPPKAAAGRARTAVAMTAAAVRVAGEHGRPRRQMTWVLSFITVPSGRLIVLAASVAAAPVLELKTVRSSANPQDWTAILLL
jgi:hypothetical protein